MAAAGLFGLVLGVKRLGSGETRTRSPRCRWSSGAALLVLFVRRQRRRAHPLVDLRMFARPAFSTSVGCIVLAMLALVGLELIAAQYLQLVLGLSPLETGLRLLPLTFAAMAAGLAGARLLRRFGPRRMVSVGFCLTAVAVVLLTAMGDEDNPALLLSGFVLLGFGLETTLFGAYESMLSEAPPEQAGGAAAIGETSYQLGAGIGIALLGSVMNAAYAPGLSSRARGPGVGVGVGGALAGRGVRGRRAARRVGRGGPAAGRPGLLRARAACDLAGECGAVAAGRGDGAAAAAGHAVRRVPRGGGGDPGAPGGRGVRASLRLTARRDLPLDVRDTALVTSASES